MEKMIDTTSHVYCRELGGVEYEILAEFPTLWWRRTLLYARQLISIMKTAAEKVHPSLFLDANAFVAHSVWFFEAKLHQAERRVRGRFGIPYLGV
jgi:hypothetical protein